MKCNKCGQNEVNFHYSSNINGCVTEAHLCSECAAREGYDIGSIFDTGSIFGRRSRPRIEDAFDFGSLFDNAFLMMPFTMIPAVGLTGQRTGSQETGLPNSSACECGCSGIAPERTNVEVDETMKQRRELNMQMKAAVESENFERAAELRDQIKALGA